MTQTADTPEAKPKAISLDTWAVALALVLALLVRLGIIQKVPW